MPERISKNEWVKKKISQEIIKGTYRSGDSLPSVELLAKKYSVSKNTVSLALSDLNRTEAIVMEQGKVTRVTDALSKPHIMVFAPRPYNMESSPFWGKFFHGMKELLQSNGDVTWKLYTEVQLLETEKRLRPLPERLDGIILLDHSSIEKMNLLLNATKEIPIVSVYENMQGRCRDIPYVGTDFRPAMFRLFENFQKLGVRTCSYIGFFGPAEKKWGADMEKFRIFMDTAKEFSMEVPEGNIQKTMPSYHCGMTAMETCLKQGKTDAVFLSSDLLAPGVYKTCRKHGLKIPGDLAVAGCDCMEIGEYLDPELTTIEPNARQIGFTAVRSLLDEIFSGKKIKTQKIPSVLIEKKSTQKEIK